MLGSVGLLRRLVVPIPDGVFQSFEAIAHERLRGRDEDDWHILALALALNSPIWPEDTDFLEISAVTWKTSSIDGFFERSTRLETTVTSSRTLLNRSQLGSRAVHTNPCASMASRSNRC